MQTLSYKKELKKEDVALAYGRNHTEKITNALVRVFKTTNAEVALPAFDEVQEDLDEIFLWMDENIPKEYTKIDDLAKAFSNLALADVFKGRIRKWQYYRFYVYCYELLSVGIALSKDEKYSGFTNYKPTTRILKMWMAKQKNAKKKQIAEKIAAKTHTSQRIVMQKTLPYIKEIFRNNKKEAEKITHEMEFGPVNLIGRGTFSFDRPL